MDRELVLRIARQLAEREAATGLRLEIASVEMRPGAGDPVVTFRPWGQMSPRQGEHDNGAPDRLGTT